MTGYSEASNSEAVDVNKITTSEDLLKKLRAGNNQKLEIGLGQLKVPVRLLNAVEEATLQAQAEQKTKRENPQELEYKVFKAQNVMKGILQAATTINGAPGLPIGFLDALTHVELSELFDQYNTLNHTINPSIESMKQEDIVALVEAVKKKQRTSSDLYTWQLAATGRFFLDSVLPMLQTDKD